MFRQYFSPSVFFSFAAMFWLAGDVSWLAPSVQILLSLSVTASPKNRDLAILSSTTANRRRSSPKIRFGLPISASFPPPTAAPDHHCPAQLHLRLGFAIHGYFPVVNHFEVILQRLIEEYSSRLASLSCRSPAAKIVTPDVVVGVPAPRWYELN